MEDGDLRKRMGEAGQERYAGNYSNDVVFAMWEDMFFGTSRLGPMGLQTTGIGAIDIACWDILGKSPADIMCATSRMVVHRKGEERPRVAACTLIPYDPGFDMGGDLAEASREVSLNHPHCARFCVLGGASCSG